MRSDDARWRSQEPSLRTVIVAAKLVRFRLRKTREVAAGLVVWKQNEVFEQYMSARHILDDSAEVCRFCRISWPRLAFLSTTSPCDNNQGATTRRSTNEPGLPKIFPRGEHHVAVALAGNGPRGACRVLRRELRARPCLHKADGAGWVNPWRIDIPTHVCDGAAAWHSNRRTGQTDA
jgi:hypothetical protein